MPSGSEDINYSADVSKPQQLTKHSGWTYSTTGKRKICICKCNCALLLTELLASKFSGMGTWWLGMSLGTIPLSSASHRILFRSGKFWKMSKPASVKCPVVQLLSSDPCGGEFELTTSRAKSDHQNNTIHRHFLVLQFPPNLILDDDNHWPPQKLPHVHQGLARAPDGCVCPQPSSGLWGFCLCTLCTGTAWGAESSPDPLPHFRGDLPWSGTLVHLQRQQKGTVVIRPSTIICWLPTGVY